MSRLRDALTADLRAAMQARDSRRVSLLRSTLSAIANAEAVDAASVSDPDVTEVERRVLDAGAIRRVVAAEIDEISAAAEDLRAHGAVEQAHDLEERAAILRTYLA